ncbi:UbiA family prenyltransferase [Candidatus Aenigmatarchaeota archaeon]
MNPYINIIRPNVCILSIIGMIVGAIVADVILNPIIILALVVTFLITGAGNVINDYFDHKIDRINRPTRPIPSGRMTRKKAAGYYVILSIIGLIVSYFVSIPFLTIALFNIIILSIYSWKLKKIAFIGNISVAYLAASNFLAAGLILNGFYSIPFTILLFFGISLIGTIAREITKDVEDVEGDRKSGAKTLPILVGERGSRFIANIFLVLALVSLSIPFIFDIFSLFYMIGAVPAVFVSVYSFSKKPPKAQKLIKLVMYFVMLGFILGALI